MAICNSNSRSECDYSFKQSVEKLNKPFRFENKIHSSNGISGNLGEKLGIESYFRGEISSASNFGDAHTALIRKVSDCCNDQRARLSRRLGKKGNGELDASYLCCYEAARSRADTRNNIFWPRSRQSSPDPREFRSSESYLGLLRYLVMGERFANDLPGDYACLLEILISPIIFETKG